MSLTSLIQTKESITANIVDDTDTNNKEIAHDHPTLPTPSRHLTLVCVKFSQGIEADY